MCAKISWCNLGEDTSPDYSFDLQDEPIDEGWPSTPPSALEDIPLVNETIRGCAPCPWSEKASWLPSWFALIRVVRSSPTRVFWEVCTGTASLTREFMRQGWNCLPPIDDFFKAEFDCLNPGFVCVVVGLVRECSVAVLHIGPPCASFSMVVNSFPQYAMRSRSEPAGFTVHLEHRAVKVTVGNSLAVVSTHFTSAQCEAGGDDTFERPWTSIIFDYEPVVKCFAKYEVVRVVTDVCFYGAPWNKPTAISTNFVGLSVIGNRCCCTTPHLPLQGDSTVGRRWTAVASPYLLGYACAGAMDRRNGKLEAHRSRL